MYRLMYLSTATVKFTDDELEALLATAQVNNQKKDITGLLIIKGRSFLQCLEGTKEDVMFIYDKIAQDSRHDNIIQVFEDQDDERYFPNWSMGFKNFNHMDAVTSKKMIDFSKIENIENFSSDMISEVFKEFVEVS